MRLTEDLAKAHLRLARVSVPSGITVDSQEAAVQAATQLGGSVMVKALIPATRRGKSGGVLGPLAPNKVGDAAHSLLGALIAGFVCERVYVERAISPLAELYLSFSFSHSGPVVMVSSRGGVDIETTAVMGEDLVSHAIDPIKGLSASEADRIWCLAGVKDTIRPTLIGPTIAAARAFAHDALVLELNPLTVTSEGSAIAVGAAIEIDDAALFRHPRLDWSPSGLTEREARVAEANFRLPGPSVRYVELNGDIGLLVGGGGAGLYQHDLLVNAGAKPANHSDMGAGASAEKLDILIESVLTHPNIRKLLVGFNTLQMARCDLIIERLLRSLTRLGFHQHTLPIVVRLNGLGSDRARQLGASWGGLTYLPPAATLQDGVATVMSER